MVKILSLRVHILTEIFALNKQFSRTVQSLILKMATVGVEDTTGKEYV